MSPPIPVEVGSLTFSAAATATAASAALPPRDRISIPAATASGCEAATIPPRQRTGERREAKVGSCIGLQTKGRMLILQLGYTRSEQRQGRTRLRCVFRPPAPWFALGLSPQ